MDKDVDPLVTSILDQVHDVVDLRVEASLRRCKVHAVAEAGEAGRVGFMPGGPEQGTHRFPAKGAAPGAMDQDVAAHEVASGSGRILRNRFVLFLQTLHM